jgi:hypothetical protein
MIKQILTALFITGCLTQLNASPLKNARFHNEAEDTVRINAILLDTKAQKGNATPEERVAYIGKQFLGTPYKAGTLEGDEEVVTVNLDEMDCTTYVETVLALAYTIGEDRNSWHDFVYNLERLRYRNGEARNYASRLHYASDWIVDNVHRGNFKEVTGSLPLNESVVKTLDFMSRNRDKYPALQDQENYEGIRNAEIGYRNHKYPYIKSTKLMYKDVLSELKEGDVVLITTKTPGLDVQHMGILIMENGQPYLMHASSAAGAVIIDKTPLSDYLRRNRTATGIRVLRLNE